MKTLIIFVTAMLLSLHSNAQNGIGSPVEGANWNNGVEGQISEYVYKNIHEAGTYTITVGNQSHSVIVEILDVSAFVKFAEGQYANHNRNWINLPGAKKWNFKGSSIWYIAKCGNRGADIKFVGNTAQITHVNNGNNSTPYNNNPGYYQPGPANTGTGGPSYTNERIIEKTEVRIIESKPNVDFEAGMIAYGRLERKYYNCDNKLFGISSGVKGFNRDLAELKLKYKSIAFIPELSKSERAGCGVEFAEDFLKTAILVGGVYFLTKRQAVKNAVENPRNNPVTPVDEDPYDGEDGGYDAGEDTDGNPNTGGSGNNNSGNTGGGINTPASPDPGVGNSGRSYSGQTINTRRQGILSSRIRGRM
ncbi:hypothetical protein CL684_00270 [Candidatus Campbellbacteria bacterium]|mgnify:CR=1 FL=1|nr:hypothetical protein [Candidatus Campbellbacteria bacterium]|tara:strand:+ start:1526 stop:2611 length:1086 start_codon:yes stop_codon:yes gene_type:complete